MHTGQEKFYNYHGQPSARLNRDESITDESIHRPRSLTFLLLSPFLFWMPDIYLTDLEKIWVDDTVNYRPWNKFINELKRDWKASTTPVGNILYSDVLYQHCTTRRLFFSQLMLVFLQSRASILVLQTDLYPRSPVMFPLFSVWLRTLFVKFWPVSIVQWLSVQTFRVL